MSLDPHRLPRTAIPSRYDVVLEPDLAGATFTGRVDDALDVREATTELVANAKELEIDRATVELADGTTVYAPLVVSNADPRVTLRLLGGRADDAWRAQVESVPITGCTVKLNMLLRELPNFRARPGTNEPHHAGQINTPLSKQQWRDCFAAWRGALRSSS